MDISFKDIEKEIPVYNLKLTQGLTELNVKATRTNSEGFIETRIERWKVLNEEHQKKICIIRPFNVTRPISNTICLSVEDVKLAKFVENCSCWEAFSSLFHKVLVYGKIVVLLESSKDDGMTRFILSIDDGTDVVIATINVTKEDEQAVLNQTGRLILERNKLGTKKEIGINIGGTLYPPESEMCQSCTKSISVLQALTFRNVRKQKTSFPLGPMKEKALVLAKLYKNLEGSNQLDIFDISFDDKIELAWKRQLNKLYLKEYLKQSKV